MFNFTPFDIEKQELEAFFETYNLCFGEKIDAAYLKWKYCDNPAGRVIAFEATHNDHFAGFYGSIPEYYFINNIKVRVYQAVDAIIHPDYRKKRLFTMLVEKTQEEVSRQYPDSFAIAVPGSNSFHGFVNKLNWKCIHHFSYIFINKHTFKLANTLVKKEEFYIHDIASFASPGIVDFLSRTQKQGAKIKPLIDPDFLDWRIKKNPLKKYSSVSFNKESTVKGIVIYSIHKKNRCCIEWIAADPDQYKNILRAFCDLIFNHKTVNFIYTWKPVSPLMTRSMRRIGFITNPFKKGPFSYKVPFIIHTNKNEINNVNLSDIENYELQPIIQD